MPTFKLRPSRPLVTNSLSGTICEPLLAVTLSNAVMCAQVAELENRLHHTTMSANEEKRAVDEIGKLRRSKKAGSRS